MAWIPPEIFSVSELTQEIKKNLESRFPFITVKGEVSNLRKLTSGHCYFSLKDEKAQISAILFKGSQSMLSHFPKNGDTLIVKGQINVYPPQGTYSLIVREIDLAGVGQLLLRFHELKKKLRDQGWFDSKIKKPIPSYPKTIGIVTSATGAVIQDIIHVLKRRFPNFKLILNPVKVQGKGAAIEIKKAIEAFNEFQLADVLIIGRGGGSLEDLWPFNEECVAKAIFESHIPIISAVGHETDMTIADAVADIRAPTPSAAAEIVTKELQAQLDFLAKTKKAVTYALLQKIQREHLKLMRIKKHPYFVSSEALLSDSYQKIDRVNELLKEKINKYLEGKRLYLYALKKELQALRPINQIASLKQTLCFYQDAFEKVGIQLVQTKQKHLKISMEKIDHTLTTLLKQKKNHLREKNFLSHAISNLKKTLSLKKEHYIKLKNYLESIHPYELLKKGYCMPFAEKDHSVIISSKSIKKNQRLHLLFHDGTVKSTVTEVCLGHGRKKS